MTHSKNAFEIRLDILKMAHDDAVGRYHHKISVARDEAQRVNAEFDSALLESLFPASADIIARAEELYAFVEGK